MMTEAQLELLRDKYVLWERASHQGPMDSRDYNARCAQALKAALCIVAAGPAIGPSSRLDEPVNNPSPLPRLGDGG